MAWASETAIANYALSLIGEATIDSIDSTTDPRAIAANAFFDAARDHLLSLHDWKFADTIVELTEVLTTNLTEFDHKFTLPSDMIRLVNIVEYSSTNPTYVDLPYEPHLVRGGNLYTDEDPCYIRYIKQITDVTAFSHWFGLALAYRLAQLVATRLTENPSKVGYYEQQAIAQLMEAMRLDEVSGHEYEYPGMSIDRIG